ncbi:MAG TPA: hypothetical protein HA261_07790 [Methanosarcina sp.]|nr:hypothetical protein [Methanosarcina sp.]
MQAGTLKEGCARIAVMRGMTAMLNSVSVAELNYRIACGIEEHYPISSLHPPSYPAA